MKKIVQSLIVGLGCWWGLNIEAANLMDVYKDALIYDPTFKAARAEWLANQENLSIVRADLLPTITAGTSLSRSIDTQIPRDRFGYNSDNKKEDAVNGWSWSIQLQQSLFDFGKISKQIANKASVKAAYMRYLAAETDLLYRVSEAYLTVLSNEDVLAYNIANRMATKKLLDQAKRKYEVGLVAITDYEEAQAHYDAALAGEIEAQNNVYIAKEKLWALTGQQYQNLSGLTEKFTLVDPNPKDIEQWVKHAIGQNFEFKASLFNAEAARDTIRVAQANHLPVINGQISYGNAFKRDHSSSPSNQYLYGSRDLILKEKDETISGIISAQMNLFAGGKVVASVKQAEYLYQQAVSIKDKTYRQVVSETRSTYLMIQSYIDKVKADRQALRSVTSSLKATEASYSVGRRTMADVLDQQANLYNRQSTLARDQYTYIIVSLKLKQLVSSLNVQDLEEINKWLSDDVTKEIKYINLHKVPKNLTVKTIKKN